MGSGTVPPGLIVAPTQLSRYGVPPAFLSQFQARPFQIQISTAGALGVMQFQWQTIGDAGLSPSIVSSGSAPPWLYTIDDVFADLTFAAGSYTLNAIYTVDALGAVSPSGLVTASLFDRRQIACSAVTREALQRMRDAIRPPLTSWGDDATEHAAAWVYAKLKRGKGATPEGAGAGDALIFHAEKLAMDFFDGIGRDGRPDSMTDTSPSADGPLIPVYPFGDTPRGW